MEKCYSLDAEEVMRDLGSSETGINNCEAEARLTKYGYNEFTEKRSRGIFKKFAEQFKDYLVIILIIAAVISGIIGEISDSAIILSVVILNSILGVIQENRAEEALKALKKMSAPMAVVIREGLSQDIPARKIVPGDIVVFEAGKYIPADLRLIEAVNLKIDESSFTGESIPVEKSTIKLGDENVPVGDRRNMAFMSSMVTYGRGKGIAVSTGMNTEIGKIADMIANAREEGTPLQKRLEQVGRWLGTGALLLCGIIFILGILNGKPAMNMFMTAVSLAVAAIPEGLPAVVTIVLAVGVQKMIKKNAIIRKLPAVETLGCATVICSDKTGTLTQNRMTVKRIFTINGFADDILDARQALKISNLCNDSQIVIEEGIIKSKGDPTETALIDIAINSGIDKRILDKEFPRVDEIPFDSSRKLMTTFNRSVDSYTANIKGAPDILLSRCSFIFDGKHVRPITSSDKEAILNANEEMAMQALRVLGVGYREMDIIEKETVEQNIIFSGLIGMIDPPRDEAKDSVKKCKTAGIKPVMITGDHKSTAVAIARDLGILENETEAISGEEIEKLSPEELKARIRGFSVYARVSPEHKVKIVEAWKANGQVVAMTGDGVNDAPALKIANIGAAMGISGTDVAKEAADMILTDDNFATIVTAIEEGRTIYSNIKKSIHYLLSCNIGEIAAIFISTLFNWPEPLLPVHILWVNLVTDSLPALALGMEPAEKGNMQQPPRNPDEGIFSKGLSFKIGLQGLLIGGVTIISFLYGLKYSVAAARSMAFFTLSLSQLIHTFNVRYENKSVILNNMFSNRYLNAAVLVSTVIQFAVLVTPAMRDIFKVQFLNINQITAVVLCSIAPLAAVEIIKSLTKSFMKFHQRFK